MENAKEYAPHVQLALMHQERIILSNASAST